MMIGSSVPRLHSQVVSAHPILEGIPAEWPLFLGYNRIAAKPGAQVLLQVDNDSFLTVGNYGQGRVAAFASDCSPPLGHRAVY